MDNVQFHVRIDNLYLLGVFGEMRLEGDAVNRVAAHLVHRHVGVPEQIVLEDLLNVEVRQTWDWECIFEFRICLRNRYRHEIPSFDEGTPTVQYSNAERIEFLASTPISYYPTTDYRLIETSGTLTSDNTWLSWNHNYSTGQSIYSNQFRWIPTTANDNFNNPYYTYQDTTITTTQHNYWQYTDHRPQLSADELARIEREYQENVRRREEQRRIENERYKKEQEAAEKKAVELLFSVLDKDQRKEFEEKKQFHVVGSKGTKYCIKHGRAHNVFRIAKNGEHDMEFCAHVQDSVPNADNILAQALLLQTDEEAFLKKANSRRLVRA